MSSAIWLQGLSGGVVAVYPDKSASFKPEDNVIVGNVCLYGAVKVGPLHFPPGQMFDRLHATSTDLITGRGACRPGLPVATCMS